MVCGFYFIILGLTKMITEKVLREQHKWVQSFYFFLGVSIIGTVFALMATYNEYKNITESISNFGAIISFLLAVYSFFREKR
mgnify:CR=1 FL=1